MDYEFWSAMLSLTVAIAVLIAALFQWWGITYRAKMVMRTWVKVFIGICVLILMTSGGLLIASRF